MNDYPKQRKTSYLFRVFIQTLTAIIFAFGFAMIFANLSWIEPDGNPGNLAGPIGNYLILIIGSIIGFILGFAFGFFTPWLMFRIFDPK
ncbi:hypothetical protein [Aequorivita capsosiphonis]|uniref:hypothetical protein n=1 Tax=Aequorivita capsosiphonis TaxID=487317 RepID=UPI00047C9F4B|nr:hypothetical protein [Aequorivita capsosiphonis]